MSSNDRPAETAEVRFLMADCTRTVLAEIAEKLPQREVAKSYGLALVSAAHDGDNPDWFTINRAILDRWSMSGLERIKRDAWKLANRCGMSMP